MSRDKQNTIRRLSLNGVSQITMALQVRLQGHLLIKRCLIEHF